jgi:hypothetical protein
MAEKSMPSDITPDFHQPEYYKKMFKNGARTLGKKPDSRGKNG